MIEVSLMELAVGGIGGVLVVVVVLVLRERVALRRDHRRVARQRVVCRLCLGAFEPVGRDPVQVCPECGGSTDRGGPRPLG